MKFGKRFISFALALVMVFGLTVGASAATTQDIQVQLSPNITVKYNGNIQSMTDVNGKPVYPLLNDGTTYLPVRAVSNMLGIDVDWDGATQTVILKDSTGDRTSVSNTGSTGTKPAPSTVTVQLSPNITVKYNGMVQRMTDVNNTPVYPILNNGTTYLPIRAVSNMLGITVIWHSDTKTVELIKVPGLGNTTPTPGVSTTTTRTFTSSANPTVEKIRKGMEMFGYSKYDIEAAVAEFESTGPNSKGGIFSYTAAPVTTFHTKTSEGAKALGEKHIAGDYVEVNWSTADDSYVKVKLTKQVATAVACNISWVDSPRPLSFTLKLDQWVKIPLPGGSDEYQLTMLPVYSKAEQDARDPDEPIPENFYAAVTADIEDKDAWLLQPHVRVDFENAPKAVARAEELTKNCKTDAEKITAIFEFVAKTIRYDHNLYNTEQKQLKDGENRSFVGKTRDFRLDHILDTKTGVCEHYAVLMAGMLRSQGIPCKVVCGDVLVDGEWEGHAWVDVSPDTEGLNMGRLGAGHDEDGWIRLDPTWGNSAGGRAAAAIDKNHKSDYAY